MWINLFYDPVFLTAIAVFVFVMLYFYWLQKREKEKDIEARLKKLEEKQKKIVHNNESEQN